MCMCVIVYCGAGAAVLRMRGALTNDKWYDMIWYMLTSTVSDNVSYVVFVSLWIHWMLADSKPKWYRILTNYLTEMTYNQIYLVVWWQNHAT